MMMCVLLCYPVSIHMSQLQATGRPISSLSLGLYVTACCFCFVEVQKTCLPVHQNKVGWILTQSWLTPLILSLIWTLVREDKLEPGK